MNFSFLILSKARRSIKTEATATRTNTTRKTEGGERKCGQGGGCQANEKANRSPLAKGGGNEGRASVLTGPGGAGGFCVMSCNS